MVLLIINILTLQMLGFINSQLGIWGILLYMPALFLLPSSIYLNGNHAIIVLTLTGFCIDYHFNVPLGFHSFALVFCHLLARGWIYPRQSPEINRSYLIQIIANVLISLSLFLFLLFVPELHWNITNILTDFLVSTLVFWFLCRWFDELCLKILNLLFIDDRMILASNENH